MKNNYMTITLSSRFKKILFKIHDKISMSLLNLENNEDFAYSFSFIDITNSDNTWSFLQVNKFNELSIQKGQEDIMWETTSRGEIRIGRLINKILPYYNSAEIEIFVNNFKAEYKNSLNNINFKIIEGNDIVKYYNSNSYSDGNGTLNKSCMRHDRCSQFMEIYAKNPDNVKMLVLFEKEQLISGRAILWKLDSPVDTWFLDRIYVKNESDTILFKKYAEDNGWLYKTSQTFNCETVIQNKEIANVDMKISVKGNYNSFPYLDTLYYYNKKDKYLTNINSEYKNIPHIIKLREINGKDSGNINYVYDIINRDYINIEDSMYCFYGDGYTHVNNAIFDKELDEYILPHMLRYSKLEKKFLTSSNSVYSKHHKSFLNLHASVKVYLVKNRTKWDYYLNSDEQNFTRINGQIYSNNILIKTKDGEIKFKEDIKEEIKKVLLDENKSKGAFNNLKRRVFQKKPNSLKK